MTATGALIARHVTDLFPTQTSRFDLAQAARRGVIAPLRCVRIPPGRRASARSPRCRSARARWTRTSTRKSWPRCSTRRPFNLAVADLYKTRFKDLPGVVYSAGVRTPTTWPRRSRTPA